MDALITVDDDEWALSAPAQAILRRTRGTLVSLSVPIQLFDDEAGDKCILNRVAAHVSHLRLFDGNHPELLPILSWSSAKYIHLNSKLLSLELEGVSLDDIDYQRVDEQTCHAKTIQLIAIQSFKPLHCGKLFPSARRLAVFGPLKIDTSAPLANLIHLELACIPSQSPLNLQTWGILASPNLFRLHVWALEEIVEPLGCWKCTSTLKKGDASLTYAGFFRPTDYICEACEQCWVTYECKRGETEFPGSTAASLSPCHRLTVIKDDCGVFQNLRLLREVISTWKERHKEMDNAEMASALIDALALAPGRRELPYATFVRKALGLQSDTESIGIKAEIA